MQKGRRVVQQKLACLSLVLRTRELKILCSSGARRKGELREFLGLGAQHSTPSSLIPVSMTASLGADTASLWAPTLNPPSAKWGRKPTTPVLQPQEQQKKWAHSLLGISWPRKLGDRWNLVQQQTEAGGQTDGGDSDVQVETRFEIYTRKAPSPTPPPG